MGSGTFDQASYRAYTQTTSGKTTDQVFSARSMDNKLNPYGVTLRESRDSADNPKSTPVIVGLDVTASMGMVADAIARNGLGTLFNAILERKPITDPHLMFMGIGDARTDTAPLQVSQFEADNRIVEQLAQLWLEKGGGGNHSESYNLPWYFAAYHTEHDAYIKRGRRGYLFTVGDECAPEDLTKQQLKRFLGDTLEGNLGAKDMLAMAQRTYDVYHVVIQEGHYYRSRPERVRQTWSDFLGEKVIYLADHTMLAETIVSVIEVAEGVTAAETSARWERDEVKQVVHDAVKHLPPGKQRKALS